MNHRWRSFLVPFVVLAIGSCGDATGPAPSTVAAEGRASGMSGPVLVECPAGYGGSATRTIGPLGGMLARNGHRIFFPPGAVPEPTVFTLTVPASPHVEIRVTANGAEHFQFQVPVTLTINYARCTRGPLDTTPLQVFYIDGQTKAILENKGGLDNKLLRQVTTVTDHFSSYAIGAN